MKTFAYYNEIEPFAVEWLRALIATGQLPDGIVDTRSITDVDASDLKDFEQCHFFAGIGVWPHALRLRNWEGRVWSGSPPCQPFSAAGVGKGTEDERHLWPVMSRLIEQCRPAAIFGEQVASAAGRAWLSSVRTDLEASGYVVGAAAFTAAGCGAPHKRNRTYFVGHARAGGQLENQGWCRRADWQSSSSRGTGWSPEAPLADAYSKRLERAELYWSDMLGKQLIDRSLARAGGRTEVTAGEVSFRSPEWLPFADGQRPVEPGTFPLAYGSPDRVGRMRGYGNALCLPQAHAFVTSAQSVLEEV